MLLLKDLPQRRPLDLVRSKVEGMLGKTAQPDELTCQAACIGVLTGNKDIRGIRRSLLALGTPGEPRIMGKLLRQHFGDRYTYHRQASLEVAAQALERGAACITHGWFTKSGHVIVLNGIDSSPASTRYYVIDTWSQFNGPAWAYNLSDIGFEGFYSDNLIYAACVGSSGPGEASDIYNSGLIDMELCNMWLHVVEPDGR